ncbi:RelA/SpoT family protein [Helicobacter himalayensis]|uniref:RelA/SpoT family protein n=1 Tax=Helicobacter himalayensis TaxID=1591088 RepID=UPI003D6FEB7A
MNFFSQIAAIDSVEYAITNLQTLTKITPNIQKAIDKAIFYHQGQFRKSGIPYVVHPICVACIVAFYGGDEVMLCAALLHDAVEDTQCSLEDVRDEFGWDCAHLVDALTKIVEIRKEEFESSKNPSKDSDIKLVASALSFRKMLLASIKDIRAFVIKICDRMHNMLTLDALPHHKQIRISEETLVVYAPIAHRLGISSLKAELEERSFYYLFPKEYEKIENYIKENHQTISLKLNSFIDSIRHLLLSNGYNEKDFSIEHRIKRHYSIYLKMQRKGVEIDEILDLLAVRIILKEPLDCYKVLGILHLNLKPVVSRLKDYIAIPKENGYQTIHTTIFDKSSIFEVQIRTIDMHKSAQYGIAAHWKYKSGGREPDLSWVNNLQYQNNSIEEFYELAKNDLYKEDIIVFSPKGDTYSLPLGAVVLDFAYAIHTDVGSRAKSAFVNHQKASLLQPLKNSDIVRIITAEQDEEVKPKCSYIDALKTSKAKNHLKLQCQQRIKEIDKKSAINILATMFEKTSQQVEDYLKRENLDSEVYKIMRDRSFFRNVKNYIKEFYESQKGFLNIFKPNRFKVRQIKLDNIVAFSNFSISEAIFDYCCHPKYGDEILGIKNGAKIAIHHKLCNRANAEIDKGAQMVFVQWLENQKYNYKILVALEDKKGAIAELSLLIKKYNYRIVRLNYDRMGSTFSTLCEVCIESDTSNTKPLKDALEQNYSIVEFSALKDAYSK